MRVFVLENDAYVTVEKDYKDVGFDLSSSATRYHVGIKDLARYWSNKKLSLDQLELGLLEALKLNDTVLEFGDYKGEFFFSFKEKVKVCA